MPKRTAPKAKPIVLQKSLFFKAEHFDCVFEEHIMNQSSTELHAHTYYEIEIITDGSGIMTLNGESYKFSRGFAYILRPTDSHSYVYNGTTTFLNLIFSENTFSKKLMDILLCSSGNNVAKLDEETMSEIISLFRIAIREQQQGDEFYDGIITSCAQAVMLLIARNSGFRDTQKENQSIFRALRYIKSNYRSSITLSDVAKSAGLSPTYFSSLFIKEVGCGYKEYLTNLRIEYAKKLLKDSDATASEVCYEAGFNSYSVFLKAFSSVVGMSPSKYIKNCNK